MPSKAAFGANDSDLKKNPVSIVTDSATNCNMFAKKYLKILENSLKSTIKSDYPAKIAKKLVFSLKITQKTLQISQNAEQKSAPLLAFAAEMPNRLDKHGKIWYTHKEYGSFH